MEKRRKKQENIVVDNDNVEIKPVKKKHKALRRTLIILGSILVIIVTAILIVNIYIDSIIDLRVKGSHVSNTYASHLHDEDTNVTNIAVIGRNLSSNKYVSEDSQTNSVKVVSLDFDNNRMVISNIHSYPMAYNPIDKDLVAFGQLYVNGGFDEFVGALNYDLDLNIDRYISISYTVNLFAQCIDILGGVDMDLNRTELEYLGIDGEPGTYHLNGKQAMDYTDYHFESKDSEQAKITDRRTVLFNKCLVLMRNASIFQLIDLAKAAMPFIETDLSNSEIKTLMLRIIMDRLFNNIVSIRYPNSLRGDCYYSPDTRFIMYDFEGFVRDVQDNIYIKKDYKSTANIKMIAEKFEEILAGKLLEGE